MINTYVCYCTRRKVAAWKKGQYRRTSLQCVSRTGRTYNNSIYGVATGVGGVSMEQLANQYKTIGCQGIFNRTELLPTMTTLRQSHITTYSVNRVNSMVANFARFDH